MRIRTIIVFSRDRSTAPSGDRQAAGAGRRPHGSAGNEAPVTLPISHDIADDSAALGNTAERRETAVSARPTTAAKIAPPGDCEGVCPRDARDLYAALA